jgi:hypothetical protein
VLARCAVIFPELLLSFYFSGVSFLPLCVTHSSLRFDDRCDDNAGDDDKNDGATSTLRGFAARRAERCLSNLDDHPNRIHVARQVRCRALRAIIL